MSLLVLIIPLSIAIVLIAIHLYATKGIKNFLIFFGMVLLYGMIKEIINANSGFGHSYSYTAAVPLRIFNVPAVVCFGWLFCAYISWIYAEKIMSRFWFSKTLRIVAVFAISIFVVKSIAYCMEMVGIAADWWVWNVPGKPMPHPFLSGWNHPYFRLEEFVSRGIRGWSLFMGAFLLVYFTLKDSGLFSKLSISWVLFPFFFIFGFMRVAETSFFIKFEFSWEYFIPAFLFLLQYNPIRPFRFLPKKVISKINALSDKSESWEMVFQSIYGTLFLVSILIIWTDIRFSLISMIIALFGIPQRDMTQLEEVEALSKEPSKVMKFIVDYAPGISGLLMISVAVYAFVFVKGEPHLLISTIPFVIFLWLSERKLPLWPAYSVLAFLVIYGFVTTDSRLLHVAGLVLSALAVLAILLYQKRKDAKLDIVPNGKPERILQKA